jgi:hypothetical protein
MVITALDIIKEAAENETGYLRLYNVQTRCMDLWQIGDDGKIIVVKRNVDKPGVN